MGLLNPALLLLAAAVAVPLILHLFQRQQGPRVIFPALRYLRRAEKEHARRIKLRQVLLLALRVAAVLLLALAAARPFLRSGGAAHEPTAVAIILDNSMSSGLILGEERLLDLLKERALETLAAARPEDRFWLIRGGSPWDPATPGDAAATMERVRATEVSGAPAELNVAVDRAATLLEAGREGLAAEIHILSGLTRASFREAAGALAAAPPVVVWTPRAAFPPNAGVTALEVGGGVPPRAGQRATVTATVSGTAARADSIPIRLVVDGRVAAAASAPVDAAVLLPFPARQAGLATGWVELDPDALRIDDRRYFAVLVEPPPTVGLGEPLPFVDEALEVLAAAGRIRRAPADQAAVVLAPAAAGVEAARAGRAAVVIAPASPLELPAANRRLAAVGVPWRYGEAVGGGESRIEGRPAEPGAAEDELERALEAVRIRESYRLERAGDGGAGGDTVLLRLRDGSAWAIRGELPGGGRYVLLATPLTVTASTLPTSAAMLPLLDRLLGAWAAAETPTADVQPGAWVALPAGTTALLGPDEVRTAVSGADRVRAPEQPGIYRMVGADEVLGAFAVNPAPAETRLERLDRRGLEAALPGWSVTLTDEPGEWRRAIFRQRVGREVWRPFLLLALALLLAEAIVAAAGGGRRGGAAPAAAVAARPAPTPDAGAP
jgi:hypothetical protein